MTDLNVRPTDLLHSFIERADTAYFIYNAETKSFNHVNAAFELLFTITAQDISAQSEILWNAIHEEDKDLLAKVYENLLQTEKVQHVECRIIRPDKTLRYVKVEAAQVKEALPLNIVGSVTDITAQKEHTNILNKFTEKKNSILEILSHDLAGPLGNIEMCGRLLMSHAKDSKDVYVVQLLDKILSNSTKSILLIREFVKQEFLESAEVKMFKQRVNLVEKIQNMFEEFKSSETIIQKNFAFITSNQPVYVMIDEVKFMQALQNLISNSIKFTKDNGHISVQLQEKENSIVITVADDGIGIPEMYHKTLFDKFSPARRAGLKGEPSVGLGMSIIKKIIEWHEGEIAFESKVNEGTTFYISVPKSE